MATHSSVNSFSKAITKKSVEIVKVNRDAVDKAAFIAKQIVEAKLQSAVGSDRAMSNLGWKGNRGNLTMKVGYDIKGRINAVAILSPRGTIGAWFLLEYGSGRHVINLVDPPPMRTPFGPRYTVKHPGTKGKNVFGDSLKAAKKPVMSVMQQRYARWLAG